MIGKFSAPIIQNYHSNTGGIGANSTIIMDEKYLERMSPDFLPSFIRLINRINKELENDRSVAADRVSELQSSSNQLAKELSGVNSNEKLTASQRYGLKGALRNLGIALVRASPKIAQTIIGTTPLAFMKEIVGESLEQIVKEGMKQKDQI